MTEAGQTETFWYDADGDRFKQTNTFTGETTHYLGRYERRTLGGVTTHVHHIDFQGQVIAIYESKSNGTQSLRYLHRDHLGSVTEITDEAGQLIERLSFDAWGKRREANWQDATVPLASSQTPRGYTGHEHLDDTSLIHMNGRVYDPDKARFTSADPLIQAAGDSQSFNRYSYVMNAPLTNTDPSGYCMMDYMGAAAMLGMDADAVAQTCEMESRLAAHLAAARGEIDPGTEQDLNRPGKSGDSWV